MSEKIEYAFPSLEQKGTPLRGAIAIAYLNGAATRGIMDAEGAAKNAYEMADAMMEARK